MTLYAVRRTRIQYENCALNTIPTRFQCVSARMKLIRAGYTNFLNMFKNFVLASQTYSHERNTIQMGRNGHRTTANDSPNQLEWSIRSRSCRDSGQWECDITNIISQLVLVVHMPPTVVKI